MRYLHLKDRKVDLSNGDIWNTEGDLLRIRLSPREQAILSYLAHDPDQLIPFHELESFFDQKNRSNRGNIKVIMSRLRKKLDPEHTHARDSILQASDDGYRIQSDQITLQFPSQREICFLRDQARNALRQISLQENERALILASFAQGADGKTAWDHILAACELFEP